MNTFNTSYDRFLRQVQYRRARVIAMRAKGMAFSEIGAKLGISRQRAQQIFAAASK